MSPNLAPVTCDTPKETAIIGETPRSAFVLRVRPNANMNRPDKYKNTRKAVLFAKIHLHGLRSCYHDRSVDVAERSDKKCPILCLKIVDSFSYTHTTAVFIS